MAQMVQGWRYNPGDWRSILSTHVKLSVAAKCVIQTWLLRM